MDKPTENAHARLDRRGELGLQTYGTDLDRDDLTLVQWAEHLANEISDAAKYVEKLVIEAKKLEHDPRAELEAWKALAEGAVNELYDTAKRLHATANDTGMTFEDCWASSCQGAKNLKKQLDALTGEGRRG